MARLRALTMMLLCASLLPIHAQAGLPSLPGMMRSLHKTIVLDYTPPPTRGLAFLDEATAFRSRFLDSSPPQIQDLVFGGAFPAGMDLGKFSFSLPTAEGGEESFPFEFALVAFGLHDRFRAFMEAFGPSRLKPAELARLLYLDLDPEKLGYYLSGFSFSASELCLIVSNLIQHGEADLGLWLAERVGQDLDPQGLLSTPLVAAAIEAKDLPALTRLLELLPGSDRQALAQLCLLRDFPEGMAPLLDPSQDNFALLKEAVSLSNSPFVDLLLPLYPRARLSSSQASSLVEAALAQGRPRNDYIFLLLLLGGFEDAARYADRALEGILTSRDYRPGLDLALRRSLGDLLIGHGADVNHVDPFYGPYLHWFASLGGASLAEKREMIRWLISRGADRWSRRDGLLYSEIPLSPRASINEKGVRLRKTPSLKGEILATLALGTAVRIREVGEIELSIDDYTGLWYRVELSGGIQGWVYGKYLTYID